MNFPVAFVLLLCCFFLVDFVLVVMRSLSSTTGGPFEAWEVGDGCVQQEWWEKMVDDRFIGWGRSAGR